MKRKIITLIVTSMVLGASLCACSNNSAENNSPNGTVVDNGDDTEVDVIDDDTPDGADDNGNAIVNPMQESTIEEVANESGKSVVVPDGLEVKDVYKISYGETIYEITLSDGSDLYIYRFQKTSEYQDISGMYYDWDEDYTAESDNVVTADVLYYYGVTNTGEGVATWYDGEWSYAIAMVENASVDKLDAMYRMLAE